MERLVRLVRFSGTTGGLGIKRAGEWNSGASAVRLFKIRLLLVLNERFVNCPSALYRGSTRFQSLRSTRRGESSIGDVLLK